MLIGSLSLKLLWQDPSNITPEPNQLVATYLLFPKIIQNLLGMIYLLQSTKQMAKKNTTWVNTSYTVIPTKSIYHQNLNNYPE